MRQRKLGAQKVLLYVLTEILKLAAPVHALHHRGDLAGPARTTASALMIERYPEYKAELNFPEDEQNFEMVMSGHQGRPCPPQRDERAALPEGPPHHRHRTRPPPLRPAAATSASWPTQARSACRRWLPEADRGHGLGHYRQRPYVHAHGGAGRPGEGEGAASRRSWPTPKRCWPLRYAKLANQNFVTRAPGAGRQCRSAEKKAKLEALIDNLKLSLENLGK